MKKTVKLLLLAVVGLVFLVGCDSGSAEVKKLPAAQTALTSWSERTSGFGSSDYTVGEEEALADLDSRFNVELMPSFQELSNLAQTKVTGENITIPAPEYTIQASVDKLIASKRILFYQGENIVSYVDITENYEYLKNREQQKVSSEYFEMIFWDGTGSYVGTDFSALVKNIGELYAIPEDDLTAGIEKIADSSEYANQEVEIYNTLSQADENGNFGQLLSVEFGSDGIPARLTARIYDNRV